MFKVIEFEDTAGGGGGIGVIRHDWLTPRKQHTKWPPQRIIKNFNKCLTKCSFPDETWSDYSIKRIFYETDDLSKAREKAKRAEIDSEVASDYCETSVRRRKKTRRIYDSDDTTESESDEEAIIYPTPPELQIEGAHKCNTSVIDQFHKNKLQSSSPSTSSDKDCSFDKHQKQVSVAKQVSVSETQNKPVTSIDEEVSLSTTLGDITLTPFLKETAPNLFALDVISRHLALIETTVKDMQISQNEILQRLRASSTTLSELSLPDGITLPCDDNEALNTIETWILTEENKKHLTTYLCFVGGNKVPVIIRRVLEKLFTNKLAMTCNWTGKNNKTPLKDLKLIKIIRDAVRSNKIAEKTTDSEIHEVISNWFRFTRDRNGGREARRVKQ